jgi:hypothetical protein
LATTPPVTIPLPVDRFTLPPIKTTDDYLAARDLIMYWLRRPGFSTARSDGALITDSVNALASQFWEGQLRTALKDGPARFLFSNTGSTFYDKGFEMLQVLEENFRPSSISNTFTTLLSLFNDRQSDKEGIHEFRSRFEGHFSALSRSSVAIPQILQVMLFLRALHSRYQDLLNQFASKQKDLSVATIDSVVADAKFMDEFVAVGANGKAASPSPFPRSPAAASALTDREGKEHRSPWEWLASYDSPGILSRWRRSLRGGFYCAFCHSKEKHHPLKCPMLAELNLKLIEVGGPTGGAVAGPKSPASGTSPTPGAQAAAVGSPPASGSESPPAPAGMTATVTNVPGDEDSTDSFRWDGDEDGVMFEDSKPKASVSFYSPTSSAPSCCRVSVESVVAAPACAAAQSVEDIVLTPVLLRSLMKAISTTSNGTPFRFAVADTGATDHMVPDRDAFISYKSIGGLRVRMGNNSFAQVLGRGTAIISLNGQRLLIRNVLHVPGLRVPLYSLRAHLRQFGCGFLGSHETGMHVYFPGVVLTVDTSSDCHLSYEPLGKTSALSSLHYVQPRCPPVVYPSERSALLARTRSQSRREQDVGVLVDSQPDVSSPHPVVPVIESPSPSELPPDIPLPSSSLTLLSTLLRDDIARLVHREGSTFPPVRPCDRANGSDTKTHWTSEELHRALGCRRFRNYKHVLQTSLDGQWIDGGEFPLALGSYATIPKSNRGGEIDHSKSCFLDVVHIDIAFGDCVSVGGFRYALILVDRATRYNWVYGLKDLSADSILSALRNFKADAGSYARCFRSDCDTKLFGTRIREHLIDNNSNIVATPAGRQSSNGLVESHWKTMVHMSRAYLTEKQMPRSFWFFSVVHSARMMNAIPGKLHGKLASPFLLVHGVGHDERTWFLLFSVCYFHLDRDGDVARSHSQAHTMDGIAVGRSPTSNALLVYNPRTKKYYEPDSYRLDPYRLPSSVYPSLTYDGGLFCSLYRDANPLMEELYPPGTRVERIDPSSHMLLAGTVMDIPLHSDPTGLAMYLILFDNGSSAHIPLADMASLIPSPPVSGIGPDNSSSDDDSSLLPPFLRVGSRITYEHDGEYHKGFLVRNTDGTYRFSFKTHVKKKSEDWGVTIPNLPFTWVDLCTEGVLLPGHVAHSFIRSSSHDSLISSPPPSTFDPVANIVSAVNLHRDCPPSLLQALASTHPDREVWLQSYHEEKGGIEEMGTFRKITLGEYRAL